MGRRFIEILICDRCGDEFELKDNTHQHITHLAFMVARRGSGSMSSNMKMDLCYPCSDIFLAMMSGAKS